MSRANPAGEATFSMRGVAKRWQSTRRSVLEGVDLDLNQGELVSVRGRNGAGKTTLLRLAAGIITPDAGSIELSGLQPRRQRRAYQRRIGLVSAGNGGLYARLSVENHLAMWVRLAMLNRAERRRAIASAREAFELAELEGRRVDRLSTGQRQRLRLALGFIHEPELILLDEPEVSLDAEALSLLARSVARARASGAAVIACAPSTGHSTLAFDRELEIDSGRLT